MQAAAASFGQRVRARIDGLPNGQQQVARFVLDNADEVVFMGVRALAERTETSTATVVRLAQSLGFDGYPAMLSALQAELLSRVHPISRLTATLEEIGATSSDADVLALSINHDAASLTRTLELTGEKDFSEALDLLDGARLVYVVGVGLSAAPATALAFRLRRLALPAVVAGEGGDLYTTVLPISDQDLLVAIGFQPIPRPVVRIAEFAHRRGSSVLAITDTQVSSLHPAADVTLHARRGPLTQLTSVVAPLSLVNALAVGLAARRAERAHEAYAALEELANEP